MNRLILRDAPLRTALELYFRTVGIKNYVIDNAVLGIVTGSGIVTRDAFPDNLFPGVTHRIKNNVLFIHQAPTAVLAERVEAVLARKLTSPTIFGEPRRVAGVAFRSGVGAFAMVERGYPTRSEIRIVACGDRFGESQVSAITEQGIVLTEGTQRMEIPLTGLVPLQSGSSGGPPQVRTAIFSDTRLSSVLDLISKAGGPSFTFENLPESYLSCETNGFEVLDFSKILMRLPVALTFTRENGVWKITPRSPSQAVAPRFVSQEDLQQGRAQLPVIFGAPRRVAAVLLGERPLALLETGNPPQTRRQTVTEGDTYESFRVEKITREGIVLNDGTRRFLVPLTPLSPKP